jgi:hypothetical protein
MILRVLGVENNSDLYARSSLCVSMLLNLGKWTFRSSYRMHLNAVESVCQENIKAHLIYGALFRVWFGRVWDEKSRLSPLLLLCLVLFFAYKEKNVFKLSFCDQEINLFAVRIGIVEKEIMS